MAAKRDFTCTWPQGWVLKPTFSFLPLYRKSVVGPRQHEPEVASHSSTCGSALHQYSMQDSLPAVMFSALHATRRSDGASSPTRGMLAWNFPAIFLPATWLCSAGKISGKPKSSSELAIMPHRKAGKHTTTNITTGQAHLETDSTNQERNLSMHVGWDFCLLLPLLEGCTAVSVSDSPLEMSTTRRLALSFQRSRTTMSGGRKRIAST
mmetsp:Transcript_86146/g.238766  ORF Transcript_86146/g.238766 Transcript_86146/m.238766 type:complete len:208 (-) Transcript_86146:2708-3331(-)